MILVAGEANDFLTRPEPLQADAAVEVKALLVKDSAEGHLANSHAHPRLITILLYVPNYDDSHPESDEVNRQESKDKMTSDSSGPKHHGESPTSSTCLFLR